MDGHIRTVRARPSVVTKTMSKPKAGTVGAAVHPPPDPSRGGRLLRRMANGMDTPLPGALRPSALFQATKIGAP